MPSPVRQRYHGRQHSHLNYWLTHYEGNTPGVEVGDNSTVRLNLENSRSPTACCSSSPNMPVRCKLAKTATSKGPGSRRGGRRQQRQL